MNTLDGIDDNIKLRQQVDSADTNSNPEVMRPSTPLKTFKQKLEEKKKLQLDS